MTTFDLQIVSTLDPITGAKPADLFTMRAARTSLLSRFTPKTAPKEIQTHGLTLRFQNCVEQMVGDQYSAVITYIVA